MKIGFRKPSIKKSIKARTTGKIKRKIKKAVIPGYGKKGMGWVKNPKKAAYNKVYNKTTFGVSDIFKTSGGKSKSGKHYEAPQENYTPTHKKNGCLLKVLGVAVLVLFGLPELFGGRFFVGVVATFVALVLFFARSEGAENADEDAEDVEDAEEKAPEDVPLEAGDINES